MVPERIGEVNPGVIWIIENTPISNWEGTVMELFEKTKQEREETDSDSFSEDWLEDDELNHKIDNMLMNGDLGGGNEVIG